jgi:hypothetical protein
MGTIADIATWLEDEVYRLGVEVRLSSYVEADDILAEGADQVILAIGADPAAPLRQVLFPAEPVVVEAGSRIVTSLELFMDRSRDHGRSVLIVDEVGHYEAIACAEFLLERGLAVTFATRHKMFAPQIEIALRTQSALERLYAKGDFTLRTGSRLVAVRPGVADIAPNFGARIEHCKADTVVWVGVRPGQMAFANELAAEGAPVVAIGDMVAARNLQTAIREGHLAARRIHADAGAEPIAAAG